MRTLCVRLTGVLNTTQYSWRQDNIIMFNFV
uniref:Uncharacterized protein n=1 Tax=Anopheles minimus TaxID=112268 RepID=A0A182WMZ4_9DIPT